MGISRKYPLIEAAIRRSPLSRSWTIAAVAGVLILLLLLMASLDGALSTLFDWSELRYIPFFIVMIAYFLVVYPYMMRSREKAVLAFKPLLSLEDTAFNEVAANIAKPNRRREWIAIFLGVAFFLGALVQPWNMDWESGFLWLTVYFIFTVTIVYGLMSWFIYDTLTGIVRVSRLSRKDLKLDILDAETLVPVARWSLVMSLVFVGLFLMGVIGMWEIILEWQTITGFVITIGITLLIFFLSMWTAHGAMNEAKNRKLAEIHRHIKRLSGEVDERMVGNQFSTTEKLSSTMSILVNYQKIVKDAPSWPFNAGVIRRLFASILAPVAVLLVKILSQVGIQLGG